VTSRNVPIARMTYQRFFRRYQKLAGMTGTASEVNAELWHVYRLLVLRIPTNRPLQRQRLPARICRTADEKWRIIVERTRELNDSGRPVQIGSRSVTASQTVSAWLERAGCDHVVLNAEQDAAEAEIIAAAGERGRITVATNMAGRGVDIRLEQSIAALCGLHVILSERHDARRIDRQLEGRCGRQGDPGSTEAILSLEDPLLDLLTWRWLTLFARTPGPLGRLSGTVVFRAAQNRAQRANARARRDLVKRDRRLKELLAFSGGME
jgi:preprotein translocase subunit SecA